ncbi:unnamed protein product [Clavelina lepadiformis]
MCNDVTFRRVGVPDLPAVGEFLLQHFHPDEPMFNMLEMSLDDIIVSDHFTLKDELGHDAAIGAFCGGELCGVVICVVGKQDYEGTVLNPHNHPKSLIEGRFYEEMLKIAADHLESEDNLIIEYLAVHPDHRRREIAKKLTKKCELLAKEYNCKHVVCIATSVYTQNILRNLEYSVARTVLHSDYVDPKTKEKPFKAFLPHLDTRIMYKYTVPLLQ